MNAMTAMKQYQSVNTQAQAVDASPHRLIQMLMEGGLTRIAQARGAMERGEIEAKGMAIGKAIRILEEGLKAGLNKAQGGDLANNLNGLYGYAVQRLTMANLRNDASAIHEVLNLIEPLADSWKQIRTGALQGA